METKKKPMTGAMIIGQLRQYKKDAIVSPICTICCVVLEILLPYLTATMIDDGIMANNMGHVVKIGVLMLIMALLAMFFGIQAGKRSARASTGLAANLREAMFKNIQTFSFNNIDKYSTAGLVTRLTTDVTNIQNSFQMILMVCTRAPISLIIAIVMALSISARLSMVFLGAVVMLVIAFFILIPMAMKYFKHLFKKYDQVNNVVKENVGAIRVVKAFVREPYETEKFGSAARELYHYSFSAEKIIIMNMPIMMFAVYSCTLLISWFGAKMIVGGTGLTTGNLTSLLSYIMNILISLMMMSMVFVMVTQSVAAAQRIEEVLGEQADIVSPEQPIMQVRSGSIDFEHVDFAYPNNPEKPVLNDIDLHIASGETIGILGSTGSSKSTLVNLISRLYDATKGCVKVGGENVCKYDLDVLRKEVAVVLQKNVLFSGTILENLRWGNEDATEEECREACRMACAEEFILRHPDGYKRKIERGGTNVSGGQKQRLCIARALLGNPKILILDDSTSAVDTATDAKIREAMKRTIPGTTKIIISQRISSIEDADRVLVLEHGSISGFDTPENLLKNNPIYQEIYHEQVGKGGGDFDEAALKGGESV